mgnify:CR=1 FL=1
MFRSWYTACIARCVECLVCMRALEHVPAPAETPNVLPVRPHLRIVRAEDVHAGVRRASDRLTAVRETFKLADPLRDDPTVEIVRLSEDDLEDDSEPSVQEVQAQDQQGEALNAQLAEEQKRSQELADRYTDIMMRLTKAQAEQAEWQQTRATSGIRRLFDAQAKTEYETRQLMGEQSARALTEAQRELQEISPLMQANNQRLDALEHAKTDVESTVESGKHRVRNEVSEQAGRELAANLAASEAVMNDIRAAERASAPLSDRLSALFQERYQLDQEQQQAEGEKEASLLRRWMPWVRTASEQAHADRERRRKRLEREMAQVLRQVGEENHRLGALYAKKDQLDEAFFRLQEAMNREAD